MSLITRCPACSTLFRVVPDQLRISDGWVRCGRCDEVFDGRAQLQTADQTDGLMAPGPQSGQQAGPEDDKERAEATAFEVAQSIGDEKAAPVPESRQGYDWSGVIDGDDTGAPDAASAVLPVAPAATGTEPDRVGDSDPLLEISPGERPEPTEPSPPADLDIVPLAEREASQLDVQESVGAEASAVRYVQSDVALIPAVENSKVTFLSAGDRARHDSKPSRILTGAIAATLILLLGGQVLLHERHVIATGFPASKRLLEGACDILGCTLEPLRRIDSIVIDSSSFIKVRGDVFRLNFSLKNSGMLEIAAPALELTLTDSQDETLARKILFPEQYMAASSSTSVLSSGFHVEATVPVLVKTPLNPQRVAGYRLLAFYP